MARFLFRRAQMSRGSALWRERATRARWALAAGACAAMLTLTGCVVMPELGGSAPQPTDTSGQVTGEPDAAPEAEPGTPEVRVQEENCGWEEPLVSGSGVAPEGQDGALADVLVGAWQHTHIDDGSGYYAVEKDIRYVFPSTDRILYCQHVPGVTDYAENAGDIELNGTEIVLPGGSITYTVVAWDHDKIVWHNPVAGGSLYLLERR